jgi:RNA polymerase sigma-70 factor (ECF subfamily)
MTSPPSPKPILTRAEKKPSTGGDCRSAAAISNTAEDEAADLIAAQASDQDAFARLYDRHAAVVLSLCRRLSLAEAEDAAQETFIRAYRLLHKVESADKLRPWLYGIARRVCSEQTRALGRRRHHEDQAMLTRTAERKAQAPSPGESLEQAEQLQRLDGAINQLDDRQRLAIHLYYLESDPIQAAQSALGLSRSGYYKLLAKARERLGELMREANPS